MPAPVRAAPPSWGRHPQTFTIGDIERSLELKEAALVQKHYKLICCCCLYKLSVSLLALSKYG
jgi:hypothetical protein